MPDTHSPRRISPPRSVPSINLSINMSAGLLSTEERTIGATFDNYSDPEAEPLTHLPPKHLLYYNLGLKMPGPIEEQEETPRSDDDKDEELPGGGGSEVKLMASSCWKNPTVPAMISLLRCCCLCPPASSFPWRPPTCFLLVITIY